MNISDLPANIDPASLPAWAHWLAQDESGVWWAFEAEPNLGHCYWYENEVGRYQHVADGSPNPDWLQTLARIR